MLSWNILHSVQNTYIFCVGLKFTDCFVIHTGALHFHSNYMLWGYSVWYDGYKENVFIFHISFLMESYRTFHSRNIVLGHKIKNTDHVNVIAIYSHLFEKWDRCFACFGQSMPSRKQFPEGIQDFTMLVVFLFYYGKIFTKMIYVLYTRIVNVVSW
jgi:hypothetical protein